jgi:hypothetical protein
MATRAAAFAALVAELVEEGDPCAVSGNGWGGTPTPEMR